ncbi:MAG: PfkB family carbohydrate kinase [Polaromonas sp.]
MVDTTAAGDTFLGALVAAWARGLKFADCVHQGMTAASLCVQTAGAQTSIPSRAQTEVASTVPNWQNL